MILLIILISLVLGLHIKYYALYLILPIIGLFIFLITRKRKILNIGAMLVSLGLGIGLSYINTSFNKDNYKGIVVEAKDNYFIFSSTLEKLYISYYDNPYVVGDYLSVKGEKKDLDFTMIESDFDFESYLEKKSIRKELKNYQISVLYKNPLRQRIWKKDVINRFNESDRGLVGSMLFGFNDNSDTTLNRNLKSLHLLSLELSSGMYIYILLFVVQKVCNKFLSDKTSKIASLGVGILFLFFYKNTLSVFRIILNWALRLLLSKFQIDDLNIFSLSGLIILLFDYHNAYQTSFLMGYTISFVVKLIHDSLFRFTGLKKKILFSTLLGFLLFPFDLMFYQDIAFLSPVYRILFTPFFVLIFFTSILCSFYIPLYRVVGFEISLLSNTLNVFNKVNPKVNAPELNPLLLIIFIIIFFLYLYYLYKDIKPVRKWIVIAYLAASYLYFLPIDNLISEEVSFINVGQGDACFIRKGQTTVLIDTGGNANKDIGYNNLIPYFKKKRIYRINLVITTHDDFDHMGALESLINNYKVESYIKDKDNFPLSIGGITFNNYNYYGYTSEGNENSLVISFRLGHKDYLITGDADFETEKKIIKDNKSIPCDILKVGHHGSKTSTSDEFLDYLKPKEAIISCGKNNKYGHPHKEVINRLKKRNIIIKRTDEMGTITYKNYIFM